MDPSLLIDGNQFEIRDGGQGRMRNGLYGAQCRANVQVWQLLCCGHCSGQDGVPWEGVNTGRSHRWPGAGSQGAARPAEASGAHSSTSCPPPLRTDSGAQGPVPPCEPGSWGRQAGALGVGVHGGVAAALGVASLPSPGVRPRQGGDLTLPIPELMASEELTLGRPRCRKRSAPFLGTRDVSATSLLNIS